MSSPFRPIGDIGIIIFFFAQPAVYGGAASAGYVVEEDDAARGVCEVQWFGYGRLVEVLLLRGRDERVWRLFFL